MTLRQESLKEEIFRIADVLHFGISNDNPDWFYTFITRANDTYLSRADSEGVKYKNWVRISELNLSEDFIEEFKIYLSLHKLWVNYSDLYNISFLIKYNIVNDFWAEKHEIIKIAKRPDLNDECVLLNEKGFDHVGNRYCLVNNDFEKTAWYYILNHPNISDNLKERFKDKKQINNFHEDNKKEKRGFLQRMFN